MATNTKLKRDETRLEFAQLVVEIRKKWGNALSIRQLIKDENPKLSKTTIDNVVRGLSTDEEVMKAFKSAINNLEVI